MDERRSAVFWVLVSASAYSMFAVFTKYVFDDDQIRPTDLVVWRFVIAAPLAWCILLVRHRRGGPAPTDAPVRPMFVLGLLFGVLAWLAFAGLEQMPAALYTVIIYTYPAMVAVGAWLLGKPAPRALWGALVITMLGIALTVPEIFSADGTQSTGSRTTGMLLTLLNAAAYAVYVLVSGRLLGSSGQPEADASRSPRRIDGFATTTWSLTGSLVFALALAAVTGVRAPTSTGAWLGVIGLAVVSTVVASATLMTGLRSLPAPTAATIATLEPLLTLVWAVTILDEVLRPVQLLGAAFVLAGVTWAQRVGAGGARSVRSPSPADRPSVSSLDR